MKRGQDKYDRQADQTPKFSTRAYTRCRICGPALGSEQVRRMPHLLPRAAYKGQIPGMKKAAGKPGTNGRRFHHDHE
jgi:small subunit ribosomal protein S14